MKKIILSAIIVFTFLVSSQVQAQHGFGTNSPDKSAAVEIVSTKRGLLIPRINLTSTTVEAPVIAPAQSLLIYNKATIGDVTPGFYYWEHDKWVRVMSSNVVKTASVSNGQTTNVSSTVSGNNTDYKVEVVEAALKLEKLGGKLKPEQLLTGEKNQVLVSKDMGNGTISSTWVNVSEVIDNGIVVGNGLTKTANKISLGGVIDSSVVLDVKPNGTLKMVNLPTLPTSGPGSFETASDKIMILNADGTLKQVSVGNVLDTAIANGTLGKTLGSDDNSILVTNGSGAVLKDINIIVKDKGVTNKKLDGGLGIADRVPVADANGDVTYQSISTALGKDLTTDGKIVIGNNKSSVKTLENAVLVATELSIKEGSINTAELANNAVTNEKLVADAVTSDKIKDGEVKTLDLATGSVTSERMKSGATDNAGVVTNATAGSVPVADGNGGVTYQTLTSAIGEDLTAADATNATIEVVSGGTDAVLVPTSLRVKSESITTLQIKDETITGADIANKTITADKLFASGVNTGDVATANADGTVSYKSVASTAGKTLETDDVIQLSGAGVTSTNKVTEVVLKDIKLTIGTDKINATHIAKGAVTSDEILDGTIDVVDIKKADVAQVLVTDANGVAKWINQTDLGNTVTANNGLTKNLNNIELGGTLLKPTQIITDGKTNESTLAIVNLQPVKVSNDMVVVERNGVLRTIARSISTETAVGLSVDSITGYTPYVQEVNVDVTAGNSNFDIKLPNAVTAKGQAINIKLVNTTEVNGYVSIKYGNNELTYGALPYQGWIIKSNGTNWIIVGSN